MLVWECLHCRLTMASRKDKPKMCLRCRKGSAWMKLIYGVYDEKNIADRFTERECDGAMPDQTAEADYPALL